MDNVKKVICILLSIISLGIYGYMWYLVYPYIENRCLQYYSDNMTAAKAGYVGGAVLSAIVMLVVVLVIYKIRNIFLSISHVVSLVLWIIICKKFIFFKKIIGYICLLFGAAWGTEFSNNLLGVVEVVLAVIVTLFCIVGFAIINSGIIPMLIASAIPDDGNYSSSRGSENASGSRGEENEEEYTMWDAIYDLAKESEDSKRKGHIEDTLESINFRLKENADALDRIDPVYISRLSDAIESHNKSEMEDLLDFINRKLCE